MMVNGKFISFTVISTRTIIIKSRCKNGNNAFYKGYAEKAG